MTALTKDVVYKAKEAHLGYVWDKTVSAHLSSQKHIVAPLPTIQQEKPL
jgi:hypothetical protein